VRTHELGRRELASFLTLSILLHMGALSARRPERVMYPPSEPEVLVLEMVQLAAVTAAPEAPEPPPAAPPVEEQAPPPPRPEPVVKATPKPPPKMATAPKSPAKAAPATSKQPAPAIVRPAETVPVARATQASPVAKARYEDLLHSWLVRHKEYPLAAKRRGLEGQPELPVRIDREGRVITSRVANPSRYPMLDEAAVAMLRRAAPFPPLPADVPGESYEFVAPVEYRLR
jgi:protein TonB